MSTFDRLRMLPMYALPHHLLSAIMHRATRLRIRAWKDWQIRWFIGRYGVDMSIAAEPSPTAYDEFNSFFTRALSPRARPICEGADTVACPADGVVSQAGRVAQGTLMQVKGQTYSMARLLGDDGDLADEFEGAPYATIYLSPRDYHRVHMPVSGRLIRMIHVPGRLFSVNPLSTRVVPELFARNERVVSVFETAHGLLAMVLVGAVFVGSIEHVWAGTVTPAKPSGRARAFTPSDTVVLEKGEEMGRFNMGSTVVFALASPHLRWDSRIQPGYEVKMGERMGNVETARGSGERPPPQP